MHAADRGGGGVLVGGDDVVLGDGGGYLSGEDACSGDGGFDNEKMFLVYREEARSSRLAVFF